MGRALLGVSGGIAAYKAVELTRLAIKAGHSVRVVMTPTAERFVGRATFEGICGAPVLVDEFDHDPTGGAFGGERDPDPAHRPISHLELAGGADAYLVAPGSANTVAKLAAGICDSILTTSFLACTAPRLIAPAMNDAMFEAAATQENLATLRRRGVEVIDPDIGELASRGEYGSGRLPDPVALLERLEARLPRATGPWDGLEVLITAGGTREPIDPVRFIGNRSSGRMGIALAAAAARRGASVTLIAANVGIDAPAGVERVDVSTAGEMAQIAGERFDGSDVLLMAAAVSDFRPREPEAGKLVREGSPTLELEPTEDVLAGLALNRREGQTLVGFAAEHGGAIVDRARAKLERKRLDAVVVNDVSDPGIGFEGIDNEVTVVEAAAAHRLPRASKVETAEGILDAVEAIRSRLASAPSP